MQLSEDLFWQYLAFRREDDAWDYKADLSLSTKRQVAEFAKDVLALANIGGGVLLLGVDGKTFAPIGVTSRIDPATLGDVLERRIGINVAVRLFYFEHQGNEGPVTLGVAEIPGSEDVLVPPRDLHGEDGKLIIQEGTIYYRRNTRSVRANAADVKAIISRVSKHVSMQSVGVQNESSAVQAIRKRSPGTRPDIFDVARDKYEPTAEEIGAKLWELWKFGTEYSKFEFAGMLRIDPGEIDEYFDGTRSLTLGQIIAASKMFNLRADYFFRASYNMRLPFWEEEIVRCALLYRVRPRSGLALITDPGAFYGSILWEFATAICKFHAMLFPESNRRRWWVEEDEESKVLSNELREALAHQYYKILEQYPTSVDRGLPQEHVLQAWFHADSSYLARLIVEGIEVITIPKSGRPRIKFRFMEDVRKGRVRFASYDATNLLMTSGRRRSPAQSSTGKGGVDGA